MKVQRILILGLIVISYSCSTEEDIPSPVEPISDVESENVYLSQNKWIYSQMNQHYLWREDLPDSLDCDFDQTPSDFFNALLSEKDRFSYMLNNPSYSASAENVWIPFSYQNYSDAKNNIASQVLYISDDQILKVGIHRGDWIKIISVGPETICLVKAKLNDGCFEYDTNIISLSISAPSKRSTVLLDSIYPGNIGYMCYNEFDEIDDLIPSLTKFHNHKIKDLVLDLRYNPGGYVRTCKYLSNCIAAEEAYGNVFQITRYNDRISKENIRETGCAELYDYFGFPTSDPTHLKGDRQIIPLNLSRVYVLTSEHTASASEALIICLRPYMNVIQIGETTVGKGVGSYTLRDKKYKYAIQPITMQYYNQQGETVLNSGLIPDHFVPGGYKVTKRNLGDISEPLLNAALTLAGYPFGQHQDFISTRSFDNSLTPIGEPSYVIEFNKKHYNENN